MSETIDLGPHEVTLYKPAVGSLWTRDRRIVKVEPTEDGGALVTTEPDQQSAGRQGVSNEQGSA